jgi:acyl-CoA synthetase (AMP-forming)/AMP-acid ligase II/acyl carrier protein
MHRVVSATLRDGDSPGGAAWPLDCSSVLEVLTWRARHHPDRLACTFLGDGDEEAASFTYSVLERRARTLARHLLDRGGAGERAMLLYPAGLEFLAALFGCLYAGVIAVPLYPPKVNRRDQRTLDVALDSGARFALTTTEVRADLDRALRHSPELGALCWVDTEDVRGDASSEPNGTLSGTDPDSIAYLQYTSGSTRVPKGVMVTHANLLANIQDIDLGFRQTSDSVAVSWLPHFHDMGLVYGLLAPLALGFPCYFMPPASFLQRPIRWLDAMSRLGATHSGGPNFAYELCVSRITPEQKECLDLGRWSVAFNGAEPVRRETLQKFADAFACCGFSPSALCPSYGLAEATLKVTSARRGQGPTFLAVSSSHLARDRVQETSSDEADATVLVGCGVPETPTNVRIVNPTTLAPCGPNEVGEIWVSSPGIARGYWNRPDESSLAFNASPAGATGGSGYLRTGDLGFLHEGELFVTGRIKDLIIVRGRNHYPNDVEFTAQNSHPALRTDSCAAFSVEVEDEERLVVVQEIDRHRHGDAELAAAAIRSAIIEEHEIAPYSVVLVRQNGVAKTSSGKVQRSACRRAFQEGTLQVVHEWKEWGGTTTETAAGDARSRDDIESFLSRRLSADLSISPDEIDVNEPFSSFGLDSLRTMALLGEIESWLGRRLSPTVFWNYPTVAGLAAHLAESDAAHAASEDGLA